MQALFLVSLPRSMSSGDEGREHHSTHRYCQHRESDDASSPRVHNTSAYDPARTVTAHIQRNRLPIYEPAIMEMMTDKTQPRTSLSPDETAIPAVATGTSLWVVAWVILSITSGVDQGASSVWWWAVAAVGTLTGAIGLVFFRWRRSRLQAR
jgi:hypothetical protein